MAQINSETKRCSQCEQIKPVKDFRRRSRNGTDRLNQCDRCHNDSERCRRARKKVEAYDSEIEKFARQITKTRTYEQIARVCCGIFAYFGGSPQFALAWLDQFERARERRPGSRATLDFFTAYLKMVEYVDATKKDAQGWLDPADEKLAIPVECAVRAQYVEKALMQILCAEPDVILEAAQHLGWTVIPPKVSGNEQQE